MKTLTSLLIFMAFFILHSCQKTDKNAPEVVSQHYVHKYGFDLSEKEWEDRNKEGQVISTLENGVTLSKTLANGVAHGPTTFTYPNSSIIQKLHLYDEGVLTKEVVYDEAGIPIQEESYEMDNRKTVTKWDVKGVPISLELYENENLICGSYYNSQNEEESQIKEGCGVRIKRDRHGALLNKEIYKNKEMIHRTAYHPNNIMQSETAYKNFVLDGLQKIYSPTGSLLISMTWSNGELHGVKTIYKNEKKHKEIPFVRGKKHGIERQFNEDGRLIAEIHWEYDLKHGSSRYYNDEETEIKWFYRGKPVSLKSFEKFEKREQVMADKDTLKKLINEIDINDTIIE